MPTHEGMWDRAIRFIVATVCLIAAFMREQQDAWFWGLLVIAAIALPAAFLPRRRPPARKEEPPPSKPD